MKDAATVNQIIGHIWREPRFVAQMEWHETHPNPIAQIMQQVGRGAVEQYAAGGGWSDPDAKVEIVIHEPPDWDWWEPTSEWRRKDAWRRACPR